MQTGLQQTKEYLCHNGLKSKYNYFNNLNVRNFTDNKQF